MSRPRLIAWLLALFGAIGLALGVLGIYGELAYAVTQRRQEIGVRVALGATPRSVLGLVIGKGMLLAGIGIAIGVGGAWLLTRSMQTVLYGIRPSDPVTFVEVVLVLLGASLLASWLPARRALKIDPVNALRAAETMRTLRRIRGTLPLLALLGCSNFLNSEDYEQLPAFEDLDFTTVEPSAPFLLWELREGIEGGTHRVLERGGSVSPATIPANILAEFNATPASTGVDPTCLPGYCYKYFVSLEGTTIRIWDSIEEVREFIGGVSNGVEAALIAMSHGFYWVPPKETGAIREVAGGYDLVVLALVEYCDPIRYDRFLVHVSTSGALQIRKREVWERQPGYCI